MAVVVTSWCPADRRSMNELKQRIAAACDGRPWRPETGFPLAICDGSYHTVMRTGAAGAVSARWMARKNSKRLAIVAAGHMAEGTLAACNEVFEWEEVRVWSRTQTTLEDSSGIRARLGVEAGDRGNDPGDNQRARVCHSCSRASGESVVI